MDTQKLIEQFDKIYFKPSQESIDKYNRVFNARLSYEKNCIAKYDYPDNRPSKPIISGEKMEDFALKFGTTIEEMKDVEMQVERALQNEKQILKKWTHIN